jgi:lipid-A-disaccharide synthase
MPQYPPSPKILIVAGEASGDHHAARLVAAIKEELPGAEFLGVGGEALAAQGVRILCPASELAVVGLSEVIGRLPAVFRALRDIGRALKTENPRLVILVDFPDFNFWVARLARFHRVPVMYYISPQVWAWRTYRVRTIARLVDRMAVIFPFEAEFYRERGVPVEYVGHPLVETLPPLPSRAALLKAWGLDPRRFTLALLPGSRGSEIERHLPIMLQAAGLIKQAIPEAQFVLPLASTAPRGLVEEMVKEFGGGGQGPVAQASRLGTLDSSPKPPSPTPYRGVGEKFEGRAGEYDSLSLSLKIIEGQSYAALSAAHLAIVASGTATVEAALAATPTIIIYRVSPLTFAVGRLLVQVEHVGMANLLAGERLFPEVLQHLLTPESLAREVLSLVRDRERLVGLRRGLVRIRERLGGPGASRRAARVALEIIGAKGVR